MHGAGDYQFDSEIASRNSYLSNCLRAPLSAWPSLCHAPQTVASGGYPPLATGVSTVRPLSDPSTDLQVRCHGSERDGRDVSKPGFPILFVSVSCVGMQNMRSERHRAAALLSSRDAGASPIADHHPSAREGDTLEDETHIGQNPAIRHVSDFSISHPLLRDLLPGQIITAIHAGCPTTQNMGLNIEVCVDRCTITATHPQMTLRCHISCKCAAERLKLREAIGDRHGRRLVKMLASCYGWGGNFGPCASGTDAAVGYTLISPVERGCGIAG